MQMYQEACSTQNLHNCLFDDLQQLKTEAHSDIKMLQQGNTAIPPNHGKNNKFSLTVNGFEKKRYSTLNSSFKQKNRKKQGD